MIRISLGNVGSGKTANEVREMCLNKSHRKTYSNIKTSLKNQIDLTSDLIVCKDLVDTKIKKSTGEATNVYDLKLNVEFWKSIKEPINVVLDEAHTILNSRRSTSKINIIMSDWMALIRRVLGATDSGMGELVFITQLPNRIDVIAREMATQIRFHVCHFKKTCKECYFSWDESSESAEPIWSCPRCSSHKILKHNHIIQVWHFRNMDSYLRWKFDGLKTYHACYLVTDIEKYFPMYNTLQWDNMFSEYY